jgi:succinyl-diaminopimelate desuccinylase
MRELMELVHQLIAIESVTPNDAGCQNLIADRLTAAGFTCQHFKKGNVDNLWARMGDTAPLIVFAGHTDVVAAGDLTQWKTPPFKATVVDEQLFGRGAADMKSALAAMVHAAIRFVKTRDTFKGSIGFLITSGEEGDEFDDGTPFLLEQITKAGHKIDYCIVGEPTCHEQLGDTIKVGRRGSLTGYLNVKGTQGHVAYPQHAQNAAHLAGDFIHQLTSVAFDAGDDAFPPTTCQVTNMHAGVGAGNVIPGNCEVQFNFRFNPTQTADHLKQIVDDILKSLNIDHAIRWRLNGDPYRCQPGALVPLLQRIIQDTCDVAPALSTTGGTSDGRFIAKACEQTLEFGLCNASIHKINEHTNVDDIQQLEDIYFSLLDQMEDCL